MRTGFQNGNGFYTSGRCYSSIGLNSPKTAPHGARVLISARVSKPVNLSRAVETRGTAGALFRGGGVILFAPMAKRKNPAAVALGRKGGQAGKGKTGIAKGFAKMDPERLRQIAKDAAAAKRDKKKAAPPE